MGCDTYEGRRSMVSASAKVIAQIIATRTVIACSVRPMEQSLIVYRTDIDAVKYFYKDNNQKLCVLMNVISSGSFASATEMQVSAQP